MLLRLLQIEVYKTFSKWRSYIGFMLFAFFIPLLIIIAHYNGGLDEALYLESSERFLFTGNLYNAFFLSFMMMNLLWIHLPFLITVAAGDLFAGEAAEGTYRYLLVRPVSRSVFFVSKWLTNMIYTFLLVFFMGAVAFFTALPFEGLGDLLVFSPDFGVSILDRSDALPALLQAYLIGAVNVLTVSTLALLFSVFVSNAVGPIIAAMGIVIIFYLVEFIQISFFVAIRPFLFSHYMDSWIYVFYPHIPASDIWTALAVHGLYISVFTLLSYVYFMRKEISS